MAQSREKTIAKLALRWYYVNYRRDLPWRRAPKTSLTNPPDVYAIWLAEIMAQQTSVVVATKYHNKFLQKWKTIKELAFAKESAVLAAWAGLGYYSRARNLHKCARIIGTNGRARFPPIMTTC